MVSAINNALSGLRAASQRLAVSANNIVNQHSTKTQVDGETVNTPYTPQRIDQISLQTGGVKTRVRDVEPATVSQFSPNDPDADANGTIQVPNIHLEEQMVEQKIATYDYKANLNTIKAENEMLKMLLDIKS